MEIDELDNKIQKFIDEMRTHNNTIAANQLSLTQRLDTLDLNGASPYLRDFGYFLRDHPDFMKREAEQESRRYRQDVAVTFLLETLQLTNIGNKLKWVGTATLTGVLLAFGSYLVSFLGEANNVFHSLGHAMFKYWQFKQIHHWHRQRLIPAILMRFSLILRMLYSEVRFRKQLQT